jgi:dipeptide/tripeptide permease
LAAIINALGIGACQPSIQSLGIKAVPIDRRGSGSSTNYIGMDIGTIIGPTLAGVLAQNYGYAVMWQLQIIPFAIAIILVIAFKTHISNIEKRFLQQS